MNIARQVMRQVTRDKSGVKHSTRHPGAATWGISRLDPTAITHLHRNFHDEQRP